MGIIEHIFRSAFVIWEASPKLSLINIYFIRILSTYICKIHLIVQAKTWNMDMYHYVVMLKNLLMALPEYMIIEYLNGIFRDAIFGMTLALLLEVCAEPPLLNYLERSIRSHPHIRISQIPPLLQLTLQKFLTYCLHTDTINILTEKLTQKKQETNDKSPQGKPTI